MTLIPSIAEGKNESSSRTPEVDEKIVNQHPPVSPLTDDVSARATADDVSAKATYSSDSPSMKNSSSDSPKSSPKASTSLRLQVEEQEIRQADL